MGNGSSSSSKQRHSHGHAPKPKPPPPPPSDSKKDSKFQSIFTDRSQGFLIELNFRNAPPRPPVGPCFVGLGLEGELNDKWTKYKPDNAIEANYSWKLHAEPDLGVPLAPSAMDYEGCYVDPSKAKKQKKNDAYDELFNDMDDDKDDTDDPAGPAPLHPDDANLINWDGHTGDTAAEELQRLRDQARAEARMGVKGKKSSSISTPKQKHLAKRISGSRVLKEKNPFFMKKTTYLANDAHQRVHDFTSLAQTKAAKEEEVAKRLRVKKSSDKNFIEESFVLANQRSTGKRKHPSKANVEAVFEIPLLPDDVTWGHNFIHVMLDNLPKEDSTATELTDERLGRAFVADVNKGEKSQRMECNLLLAEKNSSNQYNSVQKYDLDVFPLKEEDTPHSQFLFVVDEEKGTATYHPISSRVQLSSGRPSDETSSRQISKRSLNDREMTEIEEKLAEVDSNSGDKNEEADQGISSNYPFGGDSSDED
jgi:hypothetical protein